MGCGTGTDVEVNSDPVIYGNVIMGNDEWGISVKLSSSPRIENNWLSGNPTGIDVRQECNPVILHNTISSGERGVALDDRSYVIFKGNIVERQRFSALLSLPEEEEVLEGNPSGS